LETRADQVAARITKKTDSGLPNRRLNRACVDRSPAGFKKTNEKRRTNDMSNNKVIRAWKDPMFRNSLSHEERASLPENPAGVIELTDAQLEAAGAAKPTAICTYVCSIGCTWGPSCPSSLCTVLTNCPIHTLTDCKLIG
jgi:mersacidin/lichenicidin family type 2 lantibiotic